MTDYTAGILNIKIISAELTRDTDAFSKMDPYVTITWDDQAGKQTKKTTAVCTDGGKTPSWEDEEFEIKIVNPGEDSECPTIRDSIVIRLWDEDVSSSDPIAFSTVYFSQLCFDGGLDRSYPVYWEGKHAGHVRIVSKFIDEAREELMKDFNHMKNVLADLKDGPAVDQENFDKITVDFRHEKIPIQAHAKCHTNAPPRDILAGHEALYDWGTHKYCGAMDDNGELIMEFDFPRPVKFSGYAVQSANDFPARDPRKWYMTVTDLNGNEFTHCQDVPEFTDYYQYKHF
jgi:hypothetical protein